ncbi:MMPL family transporter [Micromonospora sp. Llam7]|uniref:MMPL family transporter n=1 Tax=Micromonospora tarapacensis TaxID=2835305 RepID=UPI001C8319FD|nr:MMPL family transporter [Micromonospora tarapacensis]MBX7268165.1 MMPL family transporter [Micromonospora tarapacensis]
MGLIANLVLRYKTLVILVWVAIAASGVYSSTALADRMTDGLPLPGSEAYEANVAIAEWFGTGGPQTTPLVPVVRLPADSTVDDPATATALTTAFDTLTPEALVAAVADEGPSPEEPVVRAASFFNTGDRGFVSADGRTTFGIIYPPASGVTAPGAGPDYAQAVTSLMIPALPAGATLEVTGLNALQREQEAGGGDHAQSDNRALQEALFAATGALIVLLFVFASLLALVPLFVAAVSILATYLAVLGLTYVTDIDNNIEAIVVLIGLGVAIDYSLLLVTRWREEIGDGHTGDEAVRRALTTAGRAVVVSGGTVALGLASLALLPVPILRSVGYAGLLIPIASVAVTITLLPVILATIGRRVDWPRIRRRTRASRGWTGWARGVLRVRWAAFIAGLAILGTLCFFALDLRVGEPSASAYSTGGPAESGLKALTDAGLPTGPLTPIDILVPAGTSPETVTERLASVPGLQAVAAPGGSGWVAGDGATMVTALPVHEASSGEARDITEAVREALQGLARVGGVGAQDLDFIDTIYGNMPLMLTVLLLVTFVLLARSFRSLALALKAVVLNVVSIGAAYGVVVLIWQDGYGSRLLFDAPATGSIDLLTPLIVFAFLYGLSMDYEVFILSRIREEYDKTGSTYQAVVNGLGHTGMLVTSAALILFFAFAGLGRIPITLVQVLATGLGVGILLDATVVRALLVPATVSLFGRWNWWLPAWAAKALFVAPSPAVREPSGRHQAQRVAEPAATGAGAAAEPVAPADRDVTRDPRAAP